MKAIIGVAILFMGSFQLISSQEQPGASLPNESEPTEIAPEFLFPTEAIPGDSDDGQSEEIDENHEHYDNKFDELPNSKGCGMMKHYAKDDHHDDEYSRESKIGEHPWVVLIPCEGKTWKSNYYCNGVLIDNEFVLTAAHCVSAKCKISNVRLGAWNISETPCDGKDCKGGMNVGIKHIIRHPHYNWRYLKNDIALIQLEKQIEFTDKISPICLPEADEEEMHPKSKHHDVEDKKFAISGWSKSGKGSLDIKHQTKVVGIKDSDCDSKYRRYKRKLSSSQYCVAGDDESDFCYGDAPILAMDDSKHWYVSGISSYGAPCGKKGWPDVVTRVSSYKDWIINVCTSDYDK